MSTTNVTIVLEEEEGLHQSRRRDQHQDKKQAHVTASAE
jgi:hypothetical protein